MPTIPVDSLEIYGFSDPASGKQRHLKKVRARQAIIIIGIDHLVRIFVLHAWAGRLLTTRYKDKILDTYERYQPRRFGIEANAMQELFGDLIIAEAKKRFGSSRIVGIPSPTKIEKDFKIRTTIEPVANQGRLFVHPDAVELRSELFGFPTAAYKDLIDCLAMAIMLVPRRHISHQRTDEANALAEYLRNSGAPSWYIQQRLATMSQETLDKSEKDMIN